MKKGYFLTNSKVLLNNKNSELISTSSISKICTKRNEYSIEDFMAAVNMSIDIESSGMETKDDFYWMASSFEFDDNQNMLYEIGSCVKSPCDDIPIAHAFYVNKPTFFNKEII